MTRGARRLACLLPALLAVLWLPLDGFAAAPPAGLPPENVVATAQALEDWLATPTDLPATVYVRPADGLPLVIESNINAHYGTTAPVTIDVGDAGLVFDGGYLSGETLSIVGSGTTAPVVEIVSTPYRFGNWNDELQVARVTARGSETRGGTAVRIKCGNSWSYGNSPVPSGSIEAYGPGAVALELDIPAEERPEAIYNLSLRVEGKNSLAVRSTNDNLLRFCSITAQGAGARAATDNVTLDACAVAAAISHRNTITRRIAPASLQTLYLPIRLGDESWYSDLFGLMARPHLLYDTAGAAPPVLETLHMRWDMEKLEAGMDMSHPGREVFAGEPIYLHGELGLFEAAPELVVEVLDPSTPVLSGVRVWVEDGQPCVDLIFWEGCTVGEYTLWRSDDEGAGWYDFTDAPGLAWVEGQPNILRYCFDTLPELSIFQLELADGRLSNLGYVSAYGEMYAGGSGGDRTGVDRTRRPGDEDGGKGKDDDKNKDDDKAEDDDKAPKGDRPAKPAPAATLDADVSPPAGGGAMPAPTGSGQPAPVTADGTLDPQENTVAAPAAEPGDLRYTGAQINLLVEANPETVTLLRQGVRVELPAAALAALALEDGQLFTFRVVWQADGGAEVLFFVDGVPVELPHTLTLEEAPAAEQENALPALHLAETGSDDAGAPAGMVAVLSGGALLGGGGAAWAFRRRRTTPKGGPS
ncbi:hypothetical protein LJC60_04925 [Ruminococcaceae bacterium OttesenSCG-928-D13]|nr:hypothetical protein [Ruminococcaceae bacterium OttesenSCG-928-D13]